MRNLIKIAKLNPQPDENGIFATGFANISKLDENNREIYDPNWDLKPVGKSIAGVWLAEIAEPHDLLGKCVKQGRFSPCPIEVSAEELFGNKVEAVKIDNEWCWCWNWIWNDDKTEAWSGPNEIYYISPCTQNGKAI